MTATNKCYNFVGFRCRVPLSQYGSLVTIPTGCGEIRLVALKKKGKKAYSTIDLIFGKINQIT